MCWVKSKENLVMKLLCYKNAHLYCTKSMEVNKLPGLDGLPIEVYNTKWSTTILILVRIYQQAFTRGKISHT